MFSCLTLEHFVKQDCYQHYSEGEKDRIYPIFLFEINLGFYIHIGLSDLHRLPAFRIDDFMNLPSLIQCFQKRQMKSLLMTERHGSGIRDRFGGVKVAPAVHCKLVESLNVTY